MDNPISIVVAKTPEQLETAIRLYLDGIVNAIYIAWGKFIEWRDPAQVMRYCAKRNVNAKHVKVDNPNKIVSFIRHYGEELSYTVQRIVFILPTKQYIPAWYRLKEVLPGWAWQQISFLLLKGK